VTALRVAVVGTGTGVGKTHVCCALLEAWTRGGTPAAGLKPIESGAPAEAGEPSDQERLLASCRSFHVKRADADRPFHVKRSLYSFPDPVSPHLAAERAGTAIDLAAICEWVETNAAAMTVVETAGGLFSPLAIGVDNLALVRALAPADVVLVAPDRLGVLHDVTATLGLAAARGFSIGTVVLSAPATPDASTGHNAHELTRLGITTPLAVFPRAAPSDPASQSAADRVLRSLQARPSPNLGGL
jgi:dethiobiotin synthetase